MDIGDLTGSFVYISIGILTFVVMRVFLIDEILRWWEKEFYQNATKRGFSVLTMILIIAFWPIVILFFIIGTGAELVKKLLTYII